MSVKDKILYNFNSGRLSGRTLNEICHLLSVSRGEKRRFRDVLEELCDEGLICHDDKGRYSTPERMGAISGTVSASKGGYAFLIPDDRKKYPKDLFIPGRKLRGALHGDKVLAIPVSSSGKSDEVTVVKILERGYTEIVGTLFHDKYGYFLRPDDERYAEDIFIPRDKTMNARDGMKAVAKITSFPRDKAPGGEIVEILGEGDDFFVEELSLIRSHKLREEFPASVQKAAAGVPLTVSEKSMKNRLDLRGELIITVDGEDTRDIDDAVSLEKTEHGYRLGVHIADVTHYVKYQSILDKEAYKRGTSVYFPDRVLPMLPRELSNGICSLNEGVDRLALSCIMDIDREGKVTDYRIAKSVIRSVHRMTYQAFENIANGDQAEISRYPDVVELVRNAFDLTDILKNARRKQGEVELDVKEVKILLTDENEIVIPDYKRLYSHQMIEQFMVLANETVARFVTEKKAPFIYRIHEKPSIEKAEGLKQFLLSLGISSSLDPSDVKPGDYREILEKVAPMPVAPVVNRVMLRSMMKAKYDSVNVGHFGLSSACYCHFTSPIRRYPDLFIHRVIKLILDGKIEEARTLYATVASEAALRSSECEKIATEAERDVDDLYQVVYMSERIGEVYDGVVSGVTSFGIFVELANTIEGYIPLPRLPEDSYEYFEERFLLRGGKYSFRIGDPIRIRVAGCDFGNRRTEFSFLQKI